LRFLYDFELFLLPSEQVSSLSQQRFGKCVELEAIVLETRFLLYCAILLYCGEICDENDSSVCYNRPGQNLKRDGLYLSEMVSDPILDPFLTPRLGVCSSVNLY
jgi:hypothetical protein